MGCWGLLGQQAAGTCPGGLAGEGETPKPPGLGATEAGDLITKHTCIRHLLYARGFAWH